LLSFAKWEPADELISMDQNVFFASIKAGVEKFICGVDLFFGYFWV
jgi:hypothetical protein